MTSEPPLGVTPSQTVGPFLSIALSWPDGEDVVPVGTVGAVLIEGTVVDGAGELVTDAVVETWQCDQAGRFAHPDDPRGTAAPTPAGFRGFGRSTTDAEGRWRVRTVIPAPLPAGRRTEAPHLDVSVFARGLLDRVVTRIYFPERPENAADPVLESVPAERRDTLVARRTDAGFRFDVRLQGLDETVFFET